ncbi:MAG TPA: hypothetical protein VM913_00215 [Sphingomicrobium sp.]|jgi:hypothetical protein|nr:hypothetical protein [Sphingomicrobium sp.]
MAEGSDVDYWTLVTILGPLILLGIIVWAISRNKKSGVSNETTEEGTRQVYRDEQRIHEDDKSSGL